jgi:DNA-directed RNA polymerase subunit RPC12/RpoP
MGKTSIICGRCRGRVLESGTAGSLFVELSCMRCGRSFDVPEQVWKAATVENIQSILDKAVSFDF